jgi:hypothetical protein
MKWHKKYHSIHMRVQLLSKGRMTKTKKNVLQGGAVKANDLFKRPGKSALHDMLKPKSATQKYISFT